jgi:hypothetical protein
MHRYEVRDVAAKRSKKETCLDNWLSASQSGINMKSRSKNCYRTETRRDFKSFCTVCFRYFRFQTWFMAVTPFNSEFLRVTCFRDPPYLTRTVFTQVTLAGVSSLACCARGVLHERHSLCSHRCPSVAPILEKQSEVLRLDSYIIVDTYRSCLFE